MNVRLNYQVVRASQEESVIDPTTPETPREQRLARKRGQARREILDATRDVLLREGPESVTIAGIATELGMSKGALYYYFANKDELIQTLLAELADASIDPLRTAVSEADDGLAAIEALMRAFVGEFADSLDRFRALFVMAQLNHMSAPELQQRINTEMSEVFAAAAARLEADARAGVLAQGLHARRTAVASFFAAFGLLSAMSLFEASGTQSRHDFDELLDEMVAIFRRGCAAS